MQRITAFIDAFSDWTGRLIAWLVLVMMVLTSLVVVTRYFLELGSIALQESVMFLHGIVFMLGIGYALRHQAHVRVDVLYERFSVRTRAIIDAVGTVVFLFPLAGYIFFSSLDYVVFAWKLKEASAQPGGLPGIFLLKTLIPMMAALLAIQGVAELLRNLHIAFNGRQDG